MKKFIKLLFFLICANLAQAQTFDFTSGSVSGAGGQVVQTLSGITLTVTSNPSGNVGLSSFTGSDGNTAASGTDVASLTLAFGTAVNITSIDCFDNVLNNPTDHNWTFTPTGGTNSPQTILVDGDAASIQKVTFSPSFIGITQLVITATENEAFGIDNVVHNASLPVELTSFLSILTLNSVKLKWETATEVNNYGFEVERKEIGESSKEIEWQKISFVEGHGNSNSPKKYVYEDKTFAAGKIYKYRLKQIDFDGAFEYSDELIVETTVPERAELAQNYPNPFNPSTTIKFSMPDADFANLTVYNSIGEKVAVLINENLEAGFYTYLFDGSKLASGAYVYKLETAGRVITKKMLLVK